MTYKRFRAKSVRINIGNRNVLESQNPQEFDAQKGFRQLEAEYNKFVAHVEDNMGPVIESGLHVVLDYSQDLVPVKSGELKRSGYVTSVRVPKGVLAEIGYARGGIPDYAVVVHEDLNKFHEPPTQAKFLEDAINANEAFFEDYITQATRDMAGL